MRRWTSVVVLLCACGRPGPDEARIKTVEEKADALEAVVRHMLREEGARDAGVDDAAVPITVDTLYEHQIIRNMFSHLGYLDDRITRLEGLLQGKFEAPSGWWCMSRGACGRTRYECEYFRTRVMAPADAPKPPCARQEVAWCRPSGYSCESAHRDELKETR